MKKRIRTEVSAAAVDSMGLPMNMKTSERIKELREKNNLTQAELGRRLNVTRSSVNAWEMGVSIPSTEKVAELSIILHTSSDYLLGIENRECICIKDYNEQEKVLLYQLVDYFDGKHLK